MPLPSINTIRISLAEIDGALVDDPATSPVDTGKIPCVQIHDPEGGVQPTDESLGRTPSDDESDETDTDEASIIFEIPPELDDRQMREALSQHPGRDFERLVQLSGVDALGWYLPFHQRIAQHGIYISSAGALWLAKRCFRRKYSDDVLTDISTKLHYAVHAILRHETFHFAAECMAANWELATGAPCYLKANKELKSKAGYIEKEEALANAYMLRGFRWASSTTRGAKATHSLNALTRASPPGYNRGVEYVASAKYEYGCRDLAFDYHERMGLNRFAPRMSFDSLGLYPNSFRIDWRRCPVILVDEDRLFSILSITPRFISAVQSIQETESFQKQLARLGSRYQKLWGATRGKLNRTTALSGLDFKPWYPRGKGWFSVRIDDDVRAHLRNDAVSRKWYAEEIGRHDAMGHWAIYQDRRHTYLSISDSRRQSVGDLNSAN